MYITRVGERESDITSKLIGVWKTLVGALQTRHGWSRVVSGKRTMVNNA